MIRKTPTSIPFDMISAMLLALFVGNNTTAQDYRFQVEQMNLQVHVHPDASARLEYDIKFVNQRGAHAIDIVDIGLPHAGYRISNMSASIGDHELKAIYKSEYIDTGVEVHLGSHLIRAGETNTFHFECTMPDMVYQDTTNKAWAALQIRPTWYDPNLQFGATELQIAIHLLPEVKRDEVRYHAESTKYTDLKMFDDGSGPHVVARWHYPGHILSANNPKVGVSFPKRGLQRVVTMSAIELLVKWFGENPNVQVLSGLVLLGLFVFTFYRFANGTGCVLFIVVLFGLIVMMVTSPGLHLLTWPVMIGLTGLNEWGLSRRKNSKYLPAMATVEGGGIKRGLTAPQAAVLLELPLAKSLSLLIFGMIKKGLVRVSSHDPLAVEVLDEFRCPRKERVKRAAKKGTVIHQYEHPFLDRLQDWTKPVAECDLNEAVGNLVKSTARRMAGFDLSDTKGYYQRIVKRAWKEAESIGEIESRAKAVDRNFDWMMMDPAWGSRLDDWAGRGYHYHPDWWDTGSSGGSLPSLPSSDSPSQTSFGEVASSFAGWAENTAGSLVVAIDPTSMGIDVPSGLVDLSVVDTITGDVFEALAESATSGGGGGGGGGGCACACAGCACACACAGGGR